ncbi:MAG: hypothetical protein P8X91_10435 [Candidatus Bathyarchaeota archaeon]
MLFENFKKGKENPYAIKQEALKILGEAKKTGQSNVVNEIEEMLIDIEFSIDENQCNCNRSTCQ